MQAGLHSRGGCKSFPAPPSARPCLPGAPVSRHLLAAHAEGFAGSQLFGLHPLCRTRATPCSDSPVHMHCSHALFPFFPGWLGQMLSSVPASHGEAERIPGACLKLPTLLRALLIIAGCSVAKGVQHSLREQNCVPAAARLDMPSAGEMLGDGWLCSPELWRADKLPASCSSLESIQSDGG